MADIPFYTKRIFARLAYYPTLLYGKTWERMARMPGYSRIDDTVLLGSLPFRSMTQQLVDYENVRGMVTMNEYYELTRFCHTQEVWRVLGVEQIFLHTVDLFDAPTLCDLKRGVEFIEDYRNNNKGCVYVHCKAGRTRSATLVACYLMERHHWNPSTAINVLKTRHPRVLLRRKQLIAIDDYYQQMTHIKLKP